MKRAYSLSRKYASVSGRKANAEWTCEHHDRPATDALGPKRFASHSSKSDRGAGEKPVLRLPQKCFQRLLRYRHSHFVPLPGCNSPPAM